MFPRHKRLPRTTFSTMVKAGRRLSSVHFTAIVPPNAIGYAVVVSKKTARLSVTRHRIKRRVLGVLRALPLPKALILFPKSSAGQLDSQHIRTELVGLLSKIR